MKKQNKVEKATVLNWAKVSGTILTACFLSLGTLTFAQERENVGNADVDEFGQYDANQDQQIDRDEFNNRMNGSETYNQWDADRNGYIDENEFNEGTRNWEDQQRQDYPDADDQGVNTHENATGTTGTTGTTGANDNGTFRDWDIDQSGTIDQNEFNERSYDLWDIDRDGRLNNEEFNRGINTYRAKTEPGSEVELGEDANETEMDIEDEVNTEINDTNDAGVEPETENGSDTYIENQEGDGTLIDSEIDSEVDTETEH